ncbi:MAG: hypothetical protein HY685_01115 [Chloroflexi bacterium]|nr:hypothetical protein [Chloroflexota bacterium]
MEFDFARAVAGGLAGAIAMTAAMSMGARMMGLKMDMPMTLGTMVLPKGAGAWALGLMMHLMMGVVFFIVYAALFQAFGIRTAVAGWSALFGVVHALMAGVAFGMMPVVHPRMATAPASDSDQVPAPGYWGLKLGWMGPMAIIGVHVVYGAVAGGVYAA